MTANLSAEPRTCDGVIPNDGRVYRHFVLLTGGEDKGIDALHIAFQALSELQDGDEVEAALRYLIARFSVSLRNQIPQGGRYSEV